MALIHQLAIHFLFVPAVQLLALSVRKVVVVRVLKDIIFIMVLA